MNHSRIGSDTSNEDRFVKICHFISMESEIQDHRSAIFEILEHRLENGELMYLIVDSGYRLASNSVIEKQTDRYLDMLDSYLSFREEFPESKYLKELDRMAQHARDYLDRNNKDNNEE